MAGETTGAPEAPDVIAQLIEAAPALAGVPYDVARGQVVFFPTREEYLRVAAALKAASFVMCSDLTAVDYLRHLDRPLPPAVAGERFEVVCGLLSIERRQRVRLRVQVPESDPSCATLFYLWPGSEAMEREAYDMFGIRFLEHPDLTRILMPEDWEGHPLRKDYSVGRVPVQFKDAPGPR
ncbi:MAG: NADH-quinone oxidoreductase subunit C [Actinomycetota bacterium]|nr:NADH-quinone oxidoreductase subunit C [Actinomycetota bacterium]